jgi:hypothetical protein
MRRGVRGAGVLRAMALVLGVVGSGGGLYIVWFALPIILTHGSSGTFGPLGRALGDVTYVGFLSPALGCSLLGLLGAGLAVARPRLAAGLLAVAALGLLLSVWVWAFLFAPLLLTAAALAFCGRRGRPVPRHSP